MNSTTETTNKKICFVSPDIYPTLSGKYPDVGGAELQQIFIGKGLRDRGYDISYITMDYGQPQSEAIDELTIYKTFKETEGVLGIRFLYPRLFKTWEALIQADADIYYTRTASFLPGVLSIFSRLHKKIFIFAGSSDVNFIPDRLKLPTFRDKLLYVYGLKRANAIIVQSNVQKSLLWENFKLDGIVIPNLLISEAKQLKDVDRKFILWVSNIRDMKRPMLFVRLAQRFAHEQFIMIGGPVPGHRGLFEEVARKAAKINNLAFLGFQSFERTESYFDRSKVFVNTSTYEGFPNTFLQAWRRGIPVISYVDPDNVIREKKLGMVVTSEGQLQAALRSFSVSSLWDPDPIMQYFAENHSSKVVDKYRELLETV